MTVLADFQTIIGDVGQEVVRSQNPGQQLGVAFNTGGRIAGNDDELGGDGAFLIYSVSNVFHTAEVFVNGKGPVGSIEASSGNTWSTQVITMAGTRLNSGQNTISVGVITDPFFIKDLICFYHQDSD